MVGEAEMPPVLDRAFIAAELGVRPNTITYYLAESQPGGRYASRPFPAPDGKISRAPYWLPRRMKAIRKWFAGRDRPGIGGRKRTS